MRSIGKPQIERKKKQIIKIFKDNKLDITVETNLKQVDYLDVEFNLKENKYKPYKKPNNDPLYVNKKSNHPPSVLKQIPKGIAKRLSEISSSEEIFNQAAPVYEEALHKSGFEEKLEYCPERAPRRRRQRSVIWYNPPYSSNVKTNIGREFLRLLATHFHREHAFHQIFNKNTVKLSYSCTKNISSIISGHNRKILREPKPIERECNCRNPDACPLDKKCLTANIVYEGVITSHPDEIERDYRGLCSTSFKDRNSVHKQHINHRQHASKCALAKYAWKLKDQNKTFDIKWKILSIVRGKKVGGVCKLCTTEKLAIIEHPTKLRLLNENNIQKCRHFAKDCLAKMKSRTTDTMD